MTSLPDATAGRSIAIAHEQLQISGGAEHVAFEMARELDAPIYAAGVDQDIVPDDVEAHDIIGTRVGQRAFRSHYLVRDAYQLIAWQHVEALHDYDTIVVSKNNPNWYVPKDDQATVRMVYSPPRGPYDMFHRRGKTIPSRIIKTVIRTLYEPNHSYPDEWVAISERIARRMDMYMDAEADEIIYPPVDTAEYGPQNARRDGDYYFTVGRLVDHKRVDEMVKAFTKHHRDKRLVVAGEGNERDALEQMAGPNVEFLGYIDEAEKRQRLAECKAFLFAAENEDFGLTVPEALASGTPAIGIRDGYTPSQISHGETGVLYDRGVENLARAVSRFESEGVTATPAECQQAAERYDIDSFRSQLREVVERASREAEAQRRVDPPTPVHEKAIADGGESNE